jgi:hypothetical protein
VHARACAHPLTLRLALASQLTPLALRSQNRPMAAAAFGSPRSPLPSRCPCASAAAVRLRGDETAAAISACGTLTEAAGVADGWSLCVTRESAPNWWWLNVEAVMGLPPSRMNLRAARVRVRSSVCSSVSDSDSARARACVCVCARGARVRACV